MTLQCLEDTTTHRYMHTVVAITIHLFQRLVGIQYVTALSRSVPYPCFAAHDPSPAVCPESCSAASWVFAHIAVWGCEDVFGCSPAHQLASAWWQSHKWCSPGLPGSSLIQTHKENKVIFSKGYLDQDLKNITIHLLKQCLLTPLQEHLIKVDAIRERLYYSLGGILYNGA